MSSFEGSLATTIPVIFDTAGVLSAFGSTETLSIDVTFTTGGAAFSLTPALPSSLTLAPSSDATLTLTPA